MGRDVDEVEQVEQQQIAIPTTTRRTGRKVKGGWIDAIGMAEGGLLTDVAIIFDMEAIYVPILGAVFDPAVPAARLTGDAAGDCGRHLPDDRADGTTLWRAAWATRVGGPLPGVGDEPPLGEDRRSGGVNADHHGDRLRRRVRRHLPDGPAHC